MNKGQIKEHIVYAIAYMFNGMDDLEEMGGFRGVTENSKTQIMPLLKMSYAFVSGGSMADYQQLFEKVTDYLDYQAGPIRSYQIASQHMLEAAEGARKYGYNKNVIDVMEEGARNLLIYSVMLGQSDRL